MGCRQWSWHQVQQRADPQDDLHPSQIRDSTDTTSRRTGQDIPDAGTEPRISPEGHHGRESRRRKDAMIELDETGVLQGIAPVEIRAVGRTAVEGIEKFGLRWGETVAHVWELVVDEAGIEAGDECAREDGGEDEESEGGDTTAEGANVWTAEFVGDEFESGCGVA